MLIVRSAELTDCAAIAELLLQLGYTIDSDEIRKKIAVRSDLDHVLVAELNKQVVGSISLHAFSLFHVKGNMGRITSLVVDEIHRGEKIGVSLLHAAEQWFYDKECVKFEVTSGYKRLDAHRFYEKNGYALDSQRFSKIPK